MLTKPRYLAGLILALAVCLGISQAQAAEFSATLVTKAEGQEMQGKVFVKGQKMRNEFQAGGETSISIMRPDKRVVWMLLPGERMYMEMPLTEEYKEKFLLKKPENQARMKHLGTETVNGLECDKYEVTAVQDGESARQYVWVAKKLGMPIKSVAADGSMSMEYRDIVIGEVADSVFEVPEGFEKMHLPFQMPPLR